MRNNPDMPIYRTFEEFEREELRKADAVNGAVDGLFDDMFDDADLETTGSSHYFGDDEE